MLTLDVAISTYLPEGINKVEKMLLPPRKGVNYIISWQAHDDAPIPVSLCQREDVDIHRFNLKGLSRNRNNSICQGKGDIVLIADDDLIFEDDFFEKIIDAFENSPTTDMALFKIKFKNKKIYPEYNCKIKIPFPKNYFVASVEIAFRRKKIGDLRFHPEMGLGAEEMQCGEDELFVIAAIKRGLCCEYFNRTIATHPTETTGDKISKPILRGQGFIIGIIYPFSSILRLPLKAYRLHKHKNAQFFKSLFFLGLGALKAIFDRNAIPHYCRW